ncbi:MAG: 1-(5-phosphoribosyl)-5-[(5-phosphoribosylamino)methylideneamino]imidazole-4-carboxamide isomerase [Candidatus Brocadiales bacterium]|nr:1-(5-phosphoribosyl)-5-[(5-phosphoribosylamino)methylideneamino]imidazole-4-carboxamide isomerase [Candidatus Bathyanammoxibius sp.]
MLIIPAVDIRGGRCVRLTRGSFEEETVYFADPVEPALKWQQGGAEYLHVVDLDGALEGEPKNLKELARIIKAVDIPIQFGGGIRTLETARQILDMGVDRVILGTQVVDAPELIKTLCVEFPGRIAVGLDQREGKVAVKGWVESSGLSFLDAAKQVEIFSPRALIFTDISRDGTLQGPNIELLKELLGAVKVPVIASGGVSTLDDVKALSKLPVEGAIIGKALYSGAVNLPEAIAASKTLP